jgi:hypothetical protein
MFRLIQLIHLLPTIRSVLKIFQYSNFNILKKSLNVDYKKELMRIFNEMSVPESDVPIEVTKIVLVHDIEEIIELEKELDKVIK